MRQATIRGLGKGGSTIGIKVPDHMPVVFNFRDFKVFLNAEGAVLILPPRTAEQLNNGVVNGRSRFLFSYDPKDAAVFKRLDSQARKLIPEDV